MATMIEMPKLGFDMAEGTLIKWVKKEGDRIEKGETIAEIETDKATVEVESSHNGMVIKQLVQENSTVPVGAPIAVIGEEGEEIDVETLVKGADIASPPQKTEPARQESNADIKAPREVNNQSAEQNMLKASPLAKAMARENSIDLAILSGSGPGGRIVKRDVEQYLSTPHAQEKEIEQKEKHISQGQDVSQALSKLRKKIGSRMQTSKQEIPHFYVTHEYDVEILMKMRKEINAGHIKSERVSVNDFMIKAVALALKNFPNLNASLQDDALIQHGNIHIGNAVAVEGGLLTIVCHNADQKSLLQISEEMGAMVARVRSGKVNTEDIEGSTFTISNLGMYDVDEFSAIINPPETAILAVSSAREVPVVVDGVLKAGMRMKVTLSVDHRASDGVEAAKFLQELAVYLEQPWKIW